MNRYDKDMMHNRELIYDTKQQLHRADERYKDASTILRERPRLRTLGLLHQ